MGKYNIPMSGYVGNGISVEGDEFPVVEVMSYGHATAYGRVLSKVNTKKYKTIRGGKLYSSWTTESSFALYGYTESGTKTTLKSIGGVASTVKLDLEINIEDYDYLEVYLKTYGSSKTVKVDSLTLH